MSMKRLGNLKRGPWTPEEDQKLLAHIQQHGHGSWRSLPTNAGLERCGKSCRLRWTNYLRPDIKRGKFTLAEEQTIIQLHALLGNRWSAIATHLPKRTDNEIKNYWNTHLKKRLNKMGIDPVTHKPKNTTLSSLSSNIDGGQTTKTESNLSHMAQWESARLEAEARLVRESMLRSSSTGTTTSVIQVQQHQVLDASSSSSAHEPYWLKSTRGQYIDFASISTSLSFSAENSLPISLSTVGSKEEECCDDHDQEAAASLKFSFTASQLALHGSDDDDDHHMAFPLENLWTREIIISSATINEHIPPFMNFIDGFTDIDDNLLVDDHRHPHVGDHNSSDGTGGVECNHNNGECSSTGDRAVQKINNGYDQDDRSKDYWNEILNLMNSSASDCQSPAL